MMECQIPTGLEHREPFRKDELQVCLVAQLGTRHAHCGGRRLPAVACPAASMLLHLFATGSVHHHVLGLANRELVPVVAGDDELLDPELGELSDRPCDIANNTAHHLAGGEFVAGFTKSIDLLGTDHH